MPQSSFFEFLKEKHGLIRMLENNSTITKDGRKIADQPYLDFVFVDKPTADQFIQSLKLKAVESHANHLSQNSAIKPFAVAIKLNGEDWKKIYDEFLKQKPEEKSDPKELEARIVKIETLKTTLEGLNKSDKNKNKEARLDKLKALTSNEKGKEGWFSAMASSVMQLKIQ